MKYGGELEIDRMDDGIYYVCAFHNELKKGENGLMYDNWVEILKEFEPLGKDKCISQICCELEIPTCMVLERIITTT
jgi:hypothetical protein